MMPLQKFLNSFLAVNTQRVIISKNSNESSSFYLVYQGISAKETDLNGTT
jgi:hypothetical protein